MTKNLIRFLLCLFTILGISQIGKADIQKSIIGNRVVIYKGPWNSLTPASGITHYTISNIPKSYQMAIQIVNFDAGIASVTLSNLYCSVDPNVNDFDTASNKGKFTNISFSANGVTATSSILTLVGGQTFNSGNTITTPTLPCSSVTLEFSNATQVATNVEIVATVSELVLGQTSTSGGLGAGSTTGGFVQGISAIGTNAQATFPIADGALQPAINAGFVNFGIDTFTATTGSLAPGGQTGNFLVGTPPIPSSSSNWGFVFYTGFNAVGGTGLLSPWICIPAVTSCGGSSGSGSPVIAQLSGYSTKNNVITNLTNTNNFTTFTEFISFNKTGVVRQATSVGSQVATLAGSTQLVVPQCISGPCIINSVTDTQGNKWTQVTNQTAAGGINQGGLSVWVATSSAAANTITITPNAGTTVTTSAYLELTGLTPANLNRALVPIGASNNTFISGEKDATGIFTNTSGFFVSNTTTIAAAGTITIPLWDATQHGLFSSCGVHIRVTAIAGTTPSLSSFLQDTPDNVGFADRMSFPAITAAGSFFGSVAGGGTNPIATTDGTMAVSTRLDGPLGPFGRLKLVLSGTGPSTTLTYSVECR